MVTLISHSPAETGAVGERLGRTIETGWVVGVSGELGAGKTQLIKGFARGLGVSERITSPTFALVNEYAGGRLPLFHLDLYRLETRQQIISAGLEPYFHPSGIAVVEWAERWFDTSADSAQSRAAKVLWVEIKTLSETSRQITYEDLGA
jgi:tRNA threonylcarbamoyladenosine biosynthesis protein TsaE